MDRSSGYFNEKRETMYQEERRDYLNGKLREFIPYAYKHSRAVREKLDAAKIKPEKIKTIEHLQQLPIITKYDLVEMQKAKLPFGGFETIPIDKLRRIYILPGLIYEPGEWEYKDTRWAEGLYACGFRSGDIAQNTFSYHMWPFAFMLDDSLKMLGCTTVPTGVGNTQMQVKIMHQLKVTGYVGTPSFLMSIAERAEAMGFDLRKDFSLRVGFVGAEMLPESLRGRLEGKFGMTIRQCYGTVDVGCLGYECIEKQGMHVPDDVIVEIVDPDTGKRVPNGATGEIVATNFNRTFPMIRYGTGDLSFISEEPCPCGRTSTRLMNILGRTDQVTKVRGTFIHPWQTDELMAKYPEVDKYQVVVTRSDYVDEMIFLVELADESVDKAPLKRRLEKDLQEALGVKGEVEFVARGVIFDKHKKIEDKRKWE
ncbi:MAG: AMP-binding protein [Syntrophobacterales bacterium]|nr:MAG: AMP-binding protein [Syntrophobacterales bacterium]